MRHHCHQSYSQARSNGRSESVSNSERSARRLSSSSVAYLFFFFILIVKLQKFKVGRFPCLSLSISHFQQFNIKVKILIGALPPQLSSWMSRWLLGYGYRHAMSSIAGARF